MRRPVGTHEEIRRRCGFTQAELAERAGYARAYVARVECGDARPGPRYRSAVAKALRVPQELIFGHDPNEAAEEEEEASREEERPQFDSDAEGDAGDAMPF